MARNSRKGGRRGNKEGSIYQRKDGRWVAAVTDEKKGRKKQVSRYTKTFGEARAILTRLKTRQDAALPVSFERLNVGQYMKLWLEVFIKPNRKPNTYRSYTWLNDTFIEPYLGHLPLPGLPPERIQQFLNDRRSQGLSPRTVQYIRSVLRCAFNRAVKLQRMASNPVLATESVTVVEVETVTFTAEEATRFLAAAAGTRFEGLYFTALCLGLRKGELLALRLSDIDLIGGTINVQKNLQCIKLPGQEKRSILEGSVKSGKARALPLPECLRRALARHLAYRDQMRLLASDGWQELDYLFPTTIGTPMDGRNVTAHCHQTCAKAGVPRIRFHDLRHSCGTFLHANGASPFTIQTILGHSQLSTTRRYTHVDQAIQRAALQGMDRLLADPTTVRITVKPDSEPV